MPQAHMEETDREGAVGGRTSTSARARARRLLDRWRDGGIWRRGLILAALAIILGLLMAFHASLPNDIGNLGSLFETFLPWFGLAVPVLLVLALVRRSATALIALLLPAIVWLNLFGGLLGDQTGKGGNLTVATHNVDADNPDPATTAKDVAAAGADILALEELKTSAVPTYEKTLASTYKYHSVKGTVGLWSKYPISGAQTVDIEMGWSRAMRATVATPHGKVGVYVAHLASVRVKFKAGFTANQRDASGAALGRAIRSETEQKVILLGDLNGTVNDRSLAPVTSQLRSAQGAAGSGFGFSWPASFPMARIDQILVKGMDPVSSWTLPETGSDHLPVAASVKI
ncbi:endonuclease/exonuclease/phosphatase family protein [Streptomyces varsoviensis]|uniref:Membrane protein n=1 Tax=Streptomyces varsoviensis TaxID=67373 RepID=A0ABR5J487_9ACTN|nr:endonuclease/exonuclease/phosphatase family protein [Streptomyces varsoviensis]KOG88205.1 membrane protein [Streptomyces varsoviensis]